MFGLFNLMGYRDRGVTTQQIMSEAVDLVKVADQGGFETAWFAEHHFSNYCVCPSPLLMAAHCAGVTERIKLATGIIVLPLYTPARLIAEIGMVDALSDGRLVLGVGSGYQPFEFERFGADLSLAKEQSLEIIEMIERGLTELVFEHNGAHFKQPPTHISARSPQGVPPIWVAGDAPEMQALAAQKGYTPIFTGRLADVAFLETQAQRCKDTFAAQGRNPATMAFGALRFTCVTDSKEEGRKFAENALFQNRLAANLRRRQEVMDDTGMMAELPIEGEPDIDEIVENLFIGDAETVAEKVTTLIHRVGMSHIAMFFQVGNFPHDRALRSVEQFADKVIPAVKQELGWTD